MVAFKAPENLLQLRIHSFHPFSAKCPVGIFELASFNTFDYSYQNHAGFSFLMQITVIVSSYPYEINEMLITRVRWNQYWF